MTDEILLETQCADCSGEGKIIDITVEGGEADCTSCGGTGFIPTEIGVRVLQLIRRQARFTAEFRVASLS